MQGSFVYIEDFRVNGFFCLFFNVKFNLFRQVLMLKKKNVKGFFLFYRNDASYSSERSGDIFKAVCTRPSPTTKVS